MIFSILSDLKYKVILNGLGEAILETHLRLGKARGLFTKLPDRELGPCEGIVVRDSNED